MAAPHPPASQFIDAPEAPRKRKSRWDPLGSKTFVPGIPSFIPVQLSKEAMESFLSTYLLLCSFGTTHFVLYYYFFFVPLTRSHSSRQARRNRAQGYIWPVGHSARARPFPVAATTVRPARQESKHSGTAGKGPVEY